MLNNTILKVSLIISLASITVTHNYINTHEKIHYSNVKIMGAKEQNEWIENNWVKPTKEKIKKEEEEEKRKQEQKEKEESQWIPVRVSYYTNDISDCGKTDAIGKSGKDLSRGGNYCASPSNIPFGTKLYIEGLGKVYEVQDRGGAIVWNGGVMHLDVFMPNKTQSYINELGVKHTRAKIIQ